MRIPHHEKEFLIEGISLTMNNITPTQIATFSQRFVIDLFPSVTAILDSGVYRVNNEEGEILQIDQSDFHTLVLWWFINFEEAQHRHSVLKASLTSPEMFMLALEIVAEQILDKPQDKRLSIVVDTLMDVLDYMLTVVSEMLATNIEIILTEGESA